jgi:hypothetical protein
MQNNFLTNTSNLTKKIVTEKDAITVGVNRSPVDRDPEHPVPASMPPVRSTSRWKKLILLLGLGFGVSMFEYREQSIDAHQASFGRSIYVDTQQPQVKLAPSIGLNMTSAQLAASPTTSGKTNRGDASLAAAKIATATAVVKEAKSALALSRIHVEQAEVNLETFTNNYVRTQNLHRRSAVDRHQLEQARVAYNFATTQKSHALHGLKQAQSQLTVAEVDVARVRSQLAQAIPNRKCNLAKSQEIRMAL